MDERRDRGKRGNDLGTVRPPALSLHLPPRIVSILALLRTGDNFSLLLSLPSPILAESPPLSPSCLSSPLLPSPSIPLSPPLHLPAPWLRPTRLRPQTAPHTKRTRSPRRKMCPPVSYRCASTAVATKRCSPTSPRRSTAFSARRAVNLVRSTIAGLSCLCSLAAIRYIEAEFGQSD